MSLFIREDFISHAGLPLTWKVECDALTDNAVSYTHLTLPTSDLV